MNILKTLIIISVIIITICTMLIKPQPHKHFILAPANFKLTSNTQEPKNLQSMVLFKLGDVSENNLKVIAKTSVEENTYSRSESKIIPSSVLSYSEANHTSYRTKVSDRVNNSDEELRRVDKMLNNSNAWAEMEKRFKEESIRNNTRYKSGRSASNSADNNRNSRNNRSTRQNPSNILADLDNISSGASCPLCEGLKDSKYRNELLAWNIWRSNIQNRVMDDSDVEAGYGTIFYFPFQYDKNRNISDVKVISTDLLNSAASKEVRRAINALNGKSILEFPKGTNRKSVDFTGGFVIGTQAQYATPDDYNDFESIRIQY